MAPTQSSIGGNLKSSERLVAAPQPIAALESRAPRSVPAPTESTTTVDPASSNPLLPASVAVNFADMDLLSNVTNEAATPASHNSPASDSAGGSGGGASAGFAASSPSVASPAAFDPVRTPDGDTSSGSDWSCWPRLAA